MIFCEDQTFDQSLRTIKDAVSKVICNFRREAFDFEDVVQEVLMRLLNDLPFKQAAVLYMAAKRKAIDFLRYLTGRGGKDGDNYYQKHDRGNKNRVSLSVPDDFKDFTPTSLGVEDEGVKAFETTDTLDFIESTLHGRDLYVFQQRRLGVTMKDISQDLGISESYVSLLMSQISERVQDDLKARQLDRRLHYRTDSQVNKCHPTNRDKMDRQRRIKRVANTR